MDQYPWIVKRGPCTVSVSRLTVSRVFYTIGGGEPEEIAAARPFNFLRRRNARCNEEKITQLPSPSLGEGWGPISDEKSLTPIPLSKEERNSVTQN